MSSEDRLRELLNDPRWSLPAWPDAQARVRRAARRQRLAATGIGAATAAVVAAAVVLPLALLGRGGTSVTPAVGRSSPPAATASATPSAHVTAPPLGAAGFPVSIYPAPMHRPPVNPLGLCPSPGGLQAPGPGTAKAALAVLRKLGRTFTGDLHLSDRAFWPTLVATWQPGATRLFTPGPPKQPILYSGPLQSYHQALGPPGLSHTVAIGCGDRLARDTWLIVTGPAKGPALQAEMLFLIRHGRVLLSYAE